MTRGKRRLEPSYPWTSRRQTREPRRWALEAVHNFVVDGSQFLTLGETTDRHPCRTARSAARANHNRRKEDGMEFIPVLGIDLR
jgi:hypothetical protein